MQTSDNGVLHIDVYPQGAHSRVLFFSTWRPQLGTLWVVCVVVTGDAFAIGGKTSELNAM